MGYTDPVTRAATVLLAALLLCGCGRIGFGPEPAAEPDGSMEVDAPLDAGATGLDAGADTPLDAGMDASLDAGADAPGDAGADPPIDAGTDAGPPPPCFNGVRDGDEDGVDCGGSCLATCSAAYACDAQTDIPASECWALVALYEGTNGPGWLDNRGWLVLGPCGWQGVSCVGGRVSRVELIGERQTGSMPAALGNLTNLTDLSLHTNELSGSIPAELGNLTNMDRLSLVGNQLIGTVPAELGNLTSARWFALSHNRLSGELPPSLASIPAFRFSVHGNGCLTATGAGFIAWLNRLDPLWNDGC